MTARLGDKLRSRGLTTRQRCAIIDRDAGICAECGTDTAAAMRAVLDARATHSRGVYLALPRDARAGYLAEVAGVHVALAQCVLAQHRQPADVDHIVPRAEGGSNDGSNLRVLCVECHRAKSSDDAARLARLPSTRRARRE